MAQPKVATIYPECQSGKNELQKSQTSPHSLTTQAAHPQIETITPSRLSNAIGIEISHSQRIAGLTTAYTLIASMPTASNVDIANSAGRRHAL
jgi:hypothetical protein